MFKDTGLPHELREPFFAPRNEPLPIPEATYNDTPLFCLSVNEKWVAHLLGVITALDQHDAWVGDESEQYAARQQVNEIMLMLMFACEEVEPMTFPRSQTLWHDEAIVTVGNALFRSTLAIAPFNRGDSHYNTSTYQNTAATGDSFYQNVYLDAGDYNFWVLGAHNSVHGQVDWYMDAESTPFISNQDWYAAALAPNIFKAGTVTLATGGNHILTGLVNSKNGSSAGYYLPLTKYWFEYIP